MESGMASATATKRAEGKAHNPKQASPKPPGPKHNIEAVREEYYQRIAKHSMTPLWKVMKNVVTKEPVTRCAPVIWHFDDIKRLVMESGGLITAEEAERRVLILENPAMPGESRATNTLFAGVQMILPGEVAPAHRHVSSAIRFVLDGEGAYTAVEGEKAYMASGDFVITANWAPHDHGNTSKVPMLWLDVLDFPQVNFFETSFAEQYGEATQPTSRANGDSLAFYASGVLPDGAPAHMNRSPVINYTYARTRPIIERMMKAGDIDKRHGARARYANPITGGPVLPTMGASLALFPQGFGGESYRSTDGTVFVCAEGCGTTTVEGKVLEWGPHDVFVVPPWKRYAHAAEKESVLFSISDRPAQEALGIWREDRNPH
jgi:gentisate 1,2-dioxygenase